MAGQAVNQTHAHHHAVQFYGSDAELFRTVGTFLTEGLVAGHPAIVIATPDHRAGILQTLAADLIDVPGALRAGDLVVLDAEDTLGILMRGAMPDQRSFHRTLGDLIEQTLRGRARTPVRAYGEMVDLLWRRGQADAAIRLEVLWNELASTRTFSLLCGYAIGNFYKQTSKVEEICRQHTHVFGDSIPLGSPAHP